MYRVTRVLDTSDEPEFRDLLTIHYNDERAGYIAAENRDVINVLLDMAMQARLHASHTDAAPGEAERDVSYLIHEMMGALSFAKSVIKSGEPWTDECEFIVNGAIAEANEHLRARAMRGDDG